MLLPPIRPSAIRHTVPEGRRNGVFLRRILTNCKVLADSTTAVFRAASARIGPDGFGRTKTAPRCASSSGERPLRRRPCPVGAAQEGQIEARIVQAAIKDLGIQCRRSPILQHRVVLEVLKVRSVLQGAVLCCNGAKVAAPSASGAHLVPVGKPVAPSPIAPKHLST